MSSNNRNCLSIQNNSILLIIEQQYSIATLYPLHAYNNILGLYYMQMNSNHSNCLLIQQCRPKVLY